MSGCELIAGLVSTIRRLGQEQPVERSAHSCHPCVARERHLSVLLSFRRTDSSGL